jgi:hypothetical protein
MYSGPAPECLALNCYSCSPIRPTPSSSIGIWGNVHRDTEDRTVNPTKVQKYRSTIPSYSAVLLQTVEERASAALPYNTYPRPNLFVFSLPLSVLNPPSLYKRRLPRSDLCHLNLFHTLNSQGWLLPLPAPFPKSRPSGPTLSMASDPEAITTMSRAAIGMRYG